MKRYRRKVKEFGMIYQISKQALDSDNLIITMAKENFIYDMKKAGYEPTEEITFKEIGFFKVGEETMELAWNREDAEVIDVAFYTRGIRIMK